MTDNLPMALVKVETLSNLIYKTLDGFMSLTEDDTSLDDRITLIHLQCNLNRAIPIYSDFYDQALPLMKEIIACLENELYAI